MLKQWLEFLSPKARAAKKRRANYDFLRAEITKRHQSGIGMLLVKFQDKKFDSTDLAAFRPPMYRQARNEHNDPVIIWDPKMMTEEIGFQLPEVNNGKESSTETLA